MHIRRRCHYRVNQLGPAIDANMGLHAKAPLVALLGLVHLRIPFAFPVPGRTGRIYDGGIDNCTGAVMPQFSAPIEIIQDSFVCLKKYSQFPQNGKLLILLLTCSAISCK